MGSGSIYIEAWDMNLDYDRTSTNESDGMVFYGQDNDNGTTDWYDEHGNLDSYTTTPTNSEDDD